MIDDTLPIAPNTKKNLPVLQFCLGHSLRLLNAIPTRWFSFDVFVSDTLFLPSNHPLW